MKLMTLAKIQTMLLMLFISALTYAGENAVTPSVLSLPDGPGSIGGLGEEFESVVNAGTASYTIPIDLPQGSGGLKPDIKLIYSGGYGNSEIGFGWSLPVPRIQLQTDKGVPKYQGGDKFVYHDGTTNEELVELLSGDFRLKNEGRFIRVQKKTGAWEARTKTGKILKFGLMSESKIKNETGTKIFAWNVDSISDANGNTIQYQYFNDNNQTYLERIIYNNYSSSSKIEVVFAYDNRPDALTSYRSSFPIKTAKRLQRIAVYKGGQLVRAYELTYDPASSLSRLAGITQIGSDNSSTMPPLTFAYTVFAPQNSTISVMQNAPVRSLLDSNNAIVDLNSDGLPDFLITTKGDFRYYINEDGANWSNQSQMSMSPSYELSQDGVELADLTGDGVSDLVVAMDAGNNKFLAGTGDVDWSSSTYFDNNPVGFHLEDNNTKLLDLNGDRLIDVLRTNLTSVSAWIHKGNGQYDRIGNLPKIDAADTVLFEDSKTKLGDFNGDGLLDISRVRSGNIRYWPSMGYGLFDKSIDIIAPSVDDETKLHVVDLNGDGLTDLAYLGIDHIVYWLNLGNNRLSEKYTITGTPSVDPLNTSVQFADMNGNGTTDIVWVDATKKNPWTFLDLIGDQFPNLLTQIDNGLGKIVSIKYESSTAQMLRAREKGKKWASTIPFPVALVSEIEVDDSLGSVISSTYEYSNAWYDGKEREFRGFEIVKKTEIGDKTIETLVTTVQFDLGKIDEALKGRVKKEEYADDSGKAYKEINNTWELAELAIGVDQRAVKFPQLKTLVTSIIEGNASPKYTRIDYIYDQYGNVTYEKNHGLVSTYGDDGSVPYFNDEVFVQKTFANGENEWLVGFVSKEVVSNANGVKQAETRYYYDGVMYIGLGLGEVSKGNLSRKSVWLNTEDRWIDSEKYRVDSFGNVTAILDAAGGRKEMLYDASHTYPTNEVLFTGSTALEFKAEYDNVFGRISRSTDANGSVTTYGYDPFGRLVKVVKPADTNSYPTLEYKYDIAFPISTIITRAREVSGNPSTLDSYAYIDGMGRERVSATEDVNGSFTVTKASLFNSRGREYFTAKPFRNTDLSVVLSEAKNPDKIAEHSGVHTNYDALGRTIQITNPDKTISGMKYTPLIQTIYDENDAHTSSPHYNTPMTKIFDGQNRLLISTELNAGVKLINTFEYNTLGSLVSIKDPAGNLRTVSYDSLGRMIYQSDPNAGERAYKYDDVGNLIEKIKESGDKIKYTYEPTTKRVRTKNLITNDGDLINEVTYHYDAPSGWDKHGSFLKARVSYIEDEAGAQYYGYDALGRVVSKRRDINGATYEFSYQYDALNRQVAIAYPDGSSMPISYNERGEVNKIGEYLTSRTYTAEGLPEQEILGQGIERDYTYDERSRLTSMLSKDVDGIVLQDFAYAFDQAGNITNITDARDVSVQKNQTQDLAYDDIYRLTAANYASGNIGLGYDNVGNITSKSNTFSDSRFDAPMINYGENKAGPYAITSIGAKSYTYDADGNMVKMPTQTFLFDNEDRLTGVAKDNGDKLSFAYDFDGQRKIKKLKKNDGSVEDTIYVDDTYEIRNGIAYKYVWLNGQRLARVESTPVSGSFAGSFSSENYDQLMNLLITLALILAIVLIFKMLPTYEWDLRRALAMTMVFLLVVGPMGLSITGCGGDENVIEERIAADESGQAEPVQEEEGAGEEKKEEEKEEAKAALQTGVIYYMDDHLGSTHLLVDSQGKVLYEEFRYAFGLEKYSKGEIAVDYTYTGKELDKETGLVYFGKRYYDPDTGRWISADGLFVEEPDKSVENPLSYNVFSYVRNNPVNLIDLEGYIEEQINSTWDEHTNKRIQQLHPAIRKDVINFVNDVESKLNIKLRVYSGFRSFEEQTKLYNQGRTLESKQKREAIVTKSREGRSFHNYGLAVDVVEIKNEKTNWDSKMQEVSKIGKGYGFEWGGDWKFEDKPHFQKTFNHSIDDLLDKHNKGDLKDGFVKLE